MGRKNKISIELKLKAIKEYLDGEGSTYTISSKYGVSQSTFRAWLQKYKSTGSDRFNLKHNNSYTEEFKSNNQRYQKRLKCMTPIEYRQYLLGKSA